MRMVERVPLDPQYEAKIEPVSDFGLFKGGYSGYSHFSYSSITAFNMIFSIILILFSLPALFLIGLVVKLKDGGPFLYKGPRLGLNKSIFYMYKFRTLPVGAQKTIGPKLLPPSHPMISPFSKFLRDTRLDELPQLFNILRGEMDFIGPRPIRPELYNTLCTQIPNYDNRFRVRPGLIGFSQLFTPHSAPKRIRAMIDNRLLFRKRKLFWDLGMIGYTMAGVVKEVISRSGALLWKWLKTNVFKIYQDLRGLERIRHERASAYCKTDNETAPDFNDECRLVDINESYFKIESRQKLPEKPLLFKLETVKRKKKGKTAKKRAVCRGETYKLFRMQKPGYPYAYVIKYQPVSPLNQYLIDQYFLKRSFARLAE